MPEIKSDKKQYLIGKPSIIPAGAEDVDLETIADDLDALAEAGDGDAEAPADEVLDRLTDEDDALFALVARLSDASVDRLRAQHGDALIVEEDEELDICTIDPDFGEQDLSLLNTLPLGDDPISIKIKVVDADGKGVRNARVQLRGDTWVDAGVTNNNGVVTMTMFGESFSSMRLLYIKPSGGQWSHLINNPVLNANDNIVTLKPLSAFPADNSGFPQTQLKSWGLVDMGLDGAGDPDADVRIAVIDSGLGASHPDLEAGSGRDFGESDAPDATWKEDKSGHGTHVAGVCAALNNAFGVRGFAPTSALSGLRIFPNAKNSKLIAALQWCIENNVDVVNMSLGGKNRSRLVEQQVEKCFNSGVLMVAAAGNNKGPVLFPAAFENVMAVAAIGKKGSFPETSAHQRQIGDHESDDGLYFSARFTCHGPEVNVCAPGVAVISTIPNDAYAPMDGTSMACPHVAGLAARLLQFRPDIRAMPRGAARARALFDAVIGSCRPLGIDPHYQGAGMPRLPASGGEPSPTPTPDGAAERVGKLLEDAIAIVENELLTDA
ncbi:MAG: S8 family serine peptidase [Pseudomonadota bacterium]